VHGHEPPASAANAPGPEARRTSSSDDIQVRANENACSGCDTNASSVELDQAPPSHCTVAHAYEIISIRSGPAANSSPAGCFDGTLDLDARIFPARRQCFPAHVARPRARL
jgi:hypothetical protein